MKDATVDLLYSRVRQNKGAINEIASRVKRHRNWVSLVLQGRYEDLEVLLAALQVVQEKESKRRMIKQQVSALA